MSFLAAASQWIGAHPFILSSLESKGLEFDDVIVAFDLERKIWMVGDDSLCAIQRRRQEGSLRMLRELYVAVTRARRRVVILYKGSAMLQFFESLDYVFQTTGAEIILEEFDKETTPEMWRAKGLELFEDCQYLHASRCFEAAGDVGWAVLSNGKHLYEQGRIAESLSLHRKALEDFDSSQEFENVLEIAVFLDREAFVWDPADNARTIRAMHKRPEYLHRHQVLRLAIQCNEWNEVTASDLADGTLSDVFMARRKQDKMMECVRLMLPHNRSGIEETLPLLVGDIFLRQKLYPDAIRLYLAGCDIDSATEATEEQLGEERGKSSLIKSIMAWQKASLEPSKTHVSLLLRLFRSPKDAIVNSQECMRRFGRCVVLLAFDHCGTDRTFLYDFGKTTFRAEVTRCLDDKYPKQKVEVVRWYLEKGDKEAAICLLQERLQKWNNRELCSLALLLRVPSDLSWFYARVHQKKITAWLALAMLGSQSMSRLEKEVCCDGLRGADGRHLTETELNLISLVEKTTKAPSEERQIACVEKHFQRTSKARLEQFTRQIRSIIRILETAEPSLATNELRPVYGPMFQQANKRRLGCDIVLGAKQKEDRTWYCKAFVYYDAMPLAIPKDTKTNDLISMAELALMAQQRDLAFKCSRLVMASSEASLHWTDVLRVWTEIGTTNDLAWLTENGVVGESNDTSTSLLQLFLPQEPSSAAENREQFYLMKFGATMWAYLNLAVGERPITDLAVRLTDFHGELRYTLSERLRKLEEPAMKQAKTKRNKARQKKERQKEETQPMIATRVTMADRAAKVDQNINQSRPEGASSKTTKPKTAFRGKRKGKKKGKGRRK